MMTFIDLQNAFGSVPHQYIFDMLEGVQVPAPYVSYIKSVYSHLSATIQCHQWTTPPISIRRGVFQGDTMSPIIFILTFNPLLKLAEDLNKGHISDNSVYFNVIQLQYENVLFVQLEF